MRVAAVLVSAATLTIGCYRVAEPPPKGPFAMPGVYVLQSVNGERLPVQTFGTEKLIADTLILTDAYTFKHVEQLETDGLPNGFHAAGEFAGGMGADSVFHVSMLQSEPAYAVFQVLITKGGQAMLVVWPFQFVYQKQ